MFNKIGMIACLFLIACGSFTYFFQIKTLPSDLTDYQELIAQTKRNPAAKQAPTIQTRKGVQKEIWTPKNGTRTLFLIQSEASTLSIEPKNSKFEITEELDHLQCSMQEELCAENTQEIRTLKADQGTYYFPRHQFVANGVEIQFFRLLGHSIPRSPIQELPYLQGYASEVVFEAEDKGLHFQADYLKADLNPKQTFKRLQ